MKTSYKKLEKLGFKSNKDCYGISYTERTFEVNHEKLNLIITKDSQDDFRLAVYTNFMFEYIGNPINTIKKVIDSLNVLYGTTYTLEDVK